MTYRPTNVSCEEILRRAGFSKNQYGRGEGFHIVYERTHYGYPTRRLHAFVQGREINLHYDIPKRRYKHRALYECPEVVEMVDKFKEIDGIPNKARQGGTFQKWGDSIRSFWQRAFRSNLPDSSSTVGTGVRTGSDTEGA